MTTSCDYLRGLSLQHTVIFHLILVDLLYTHVIYAHGSQLTHGVLHSWDVWLYARMPVIPRTDSSRVSLAIPQPPLFTQL
jgi:hypothetical protein